jgi:hypothetical protein
LRREARLIALESHQRQRQLVQVVTLLRAAGIEAILIKGWSVARHYPCPERRPLGDLDLCVAPESLSTAVGLVERLGLPPQAVDLHAGVPDLPGESWERLLARSHVATLHGTTVRVLAPVDLFRLVCLHFVRHLGSRPLWLVDVAILMETQAETFRASPPRNVSGAAGDWVRQVAHLAATLLGARSPWPAPARVPTWLAPSVLWLWGYLGAMPSLREVLRTPRELPDALRFRWSHPTRAAWRLGLAPTTPLWCIQAAALLARPWQGAVRLCRALQFRSQGSVVVHEDRTF